MHIPSTYSSSSDQQPPVPNPVKQLVDREVSEATAAETEEVRELKIK